jgi:hypothetical protein
MSEFCEEKRKSKKRPISIKKGPLCLSEKGLAGIRNNAIKRAKKSQLYNSFTNREKCCDIAS